ncbi:hypothetical protein ACP70R_006287 [Stipagrostis hirtigluma subsp. patula]
MPRPREGARGSVTLALAVLVIFTSRAASGARAPKEETFGYEKGGPNGPAKWATLQKAWAVCGSGTEQSPIDIAEVEASDDLEPLEQTYKAGTAVVQNHGHDFMLAWTDGNGNLTVDGKEYTLMQVHWHAPSEHTVNGTGFDAEMHMVHEGPEKAKAVVSVLFSAKADKPSKLLGDLGPYFKRPGYSPLNTVTAALPAAAECLSRLFKTMMGQYFERLSGTDGEEEKVKDPVDPTDWIDKESGYYRYKGSLTTPPCTEGVIWTIMSKVADASKEQTALIKSVGKTKESNARPTQKINKRVVQYYKPGSKDEPGKKGAREKAAPGPRSSKSKKS